MFPNKYRERESYLAGGLRMSGSYVAKYLVTYTVSYLIGCSVRVEM